VSEVLRLSKEDLPGFFSESVKEVGGMLREQNKTHKKLEEWQEFNSPISWGS
jgi:hypothetical protein